MNRIVLMSAMVIGLLTSAALAHDEDLRSGQLKRTVGQISNEVALSRLRMAGVANPRIVRREGTSMIFNGTVEGRELTIEFNTLSGHAVETGPQSRMLIGPRGALVRPVIDRAQIPVEPHVLSNPALMRGVVVPH